LPAYLELREHRYLETVVVRSKLPMTNFPYDIQMTSMFIFITLYLIFKVINWL